MIKSLDLSKFSARERASIEEGNRIIEARRLAARKDEAARQTELAAKRSNAITSRVGPVTAAKCFGIQAKASKATVTTAAPKIDVNQLKAAMKSAALVAARKAFKASPPVAKQSAPRSRSTMHFMVAKRPSHRLIYAGSFAR